MRLALLPLCLLAAVALPAPVGADTLPTPSELEAKLTNLLSNRLAGPANIRFEKAITLTAEGDGFTATVPAARIELGNGRYAATKPAALTLTPAAPGHYNYSLEMAQPLLTFYDITDVPTYKLTTAELSLRGIWDTGHNILTRVSLTAPSASVNNEHRLKLAGQSGRVTFEQNAHVDPSGRLQSTTQLSVAALRVFDETGDEVLSARGLGASYHLNGDNWESYFATAPAGNPAGVQIPRTPQDAVKMMLERTGKAAYAFAVRDGFVQDTQSSQLATMVRSTSFNRLGAVVATAMGQNGHFQADLNYSHEGFNAIDNTAPVVADVAPVSLTLSASLDRLPVGAMWGKAQDTDTSGVPQSADEPGVLKQKASFTALMDRADTVFRIKELSYAAPLLTIRGTSRIEAAEKATFGLTGNLLLTVGGLDPLIQKLGSARMAAGAIPINPSPETQQMLMGLNMLRGFGRPVPNDPSGARTYEIEVTSTGDARLNGTSLMGLFAGLNSLSGAPISEVPATSP